MELALDRATVRQLRVRRGFVELASAPAPAPDTARQYPHRVADGLEVTVAWGPPSAAKINGRVLRLSSSDVAVVYPGDTWTSVSRRAYRSLLIDPQAWATLSEGPVPRGLGHRLEGPGARSQTLRLWQLLAASHPTDTATRERALQAWIGEFLGPTSALSAPLRSERKRVVTAICRAMNENLEARWRQTDLLKQCPRPWSRHQMARAFRAELGCSPREHLLALRLAEARRRIRHGEAISNISEALGFFDPAHFRRTFRDAFGVKPSALRAEEGTNERSGSISDVLESPAGGGEIGGCASRRPD